MSSNGHSDGEHKLESWKEIAAFFERDLRTVIRWEKELGLPVHRYPGKTKGRIYAHTSELEAWADGPRRVAAKVDRVAETTIGVAEPEDHALSLDLDTDTEADPRSNFSIKRRRIWIACAIAVLAVAMVIGFATWRVRHPKSISSVAVLPFDNLGDASDPAFVEGLTDEIASSLSRIGGVRVAGRRSAYTFQGKRTDLREIGSTLDVEAVVEGSVQRSGDQTRVAVQLNRTRDGFTIWAQTFDSNTGDWIVTESEISSAVAHALSQDAGAAGPGTSDPEARAFYLKGRYLWNQRNFDAEKKSVEYMRQAIVRDPSYAQAWSGLADSLVTIGNLENVRPADYIPEARDAARKALELEPNLADAHAVLGRIAAHYDYDWATAESEYKKALALNPSYATAHQYYALGLMAHGRLAEAKHQLDLASELDPLALIVGVDKALLSKFQKDYAGVIRESQRVLQLDPNYKTGYSMLATGYYLTHRWDDWRQVDAKYPQVSVSRALANGNVAEAHQLLTELEKQAERDEVPAALLVTQAVRAGDVKLALDWLERSYENHDYWLLFMNVDPEMDPIRSEPRFQAMMKKLGVG